ncbi:MAG: glycosyltransferase family 2 protein [Hellea sp.]|nr:glycosyltransferase family 2 protein [Hellea sp.]
MEKQYQLSIVIINYKTPQLVIDCLESVLSELENLDAKVIVVDNASNDKSCELIQGWITEQAVSEQVEVLSSTGNTGFSGGNNFGIRHISAEYYLLLNSDTLVRKGAISLLLDAIKGDKSVGLISPRLEWPDSTPQESCFRFHSPVSELILSANTGLITQLFKSFNVPYPVSDNIDFYDWTSFACVLVRAKVFKDIGLMDDGYFMYFEDVSFSYHAKLAGWKVMNLPDARVVHLRGGSSSVKSRASLRKRLPRYYYESRTRYFYQTYGHFGLLRANILWTLGHSVALVRASLSSSFVPTASAFQWRDIWINFFAPLKAYIHPDNYDKT